MLRKILKTDLTADEITLLVTVIMYIKQSLLVSAILIFVTVVKVLGRKGKGINLIVKIAALILSVIMACTFVIHFAYGLGSALFGINAGLKNVVLVFPIAALISIYKRIHQPQYTDDSFKLVKNSSIEEHKYIKAIDEMMELLLNESRLTEQAFKNAVMTLVDSNGLDFKYENSVHFPKYLLWLFARETQAIKNTCHDIDVNKLIELAVLKFSIRINYPPEHIQSYLKAFESTLEKNMLSSMLLIDLGIIEPQKKTHINPISWTMFELNVPGNGYWKKVLNS